ncbi:MAG TPA: HlyD family efflux transporter periplasmic adaptor subunit [Pyrinomonadaceae bacterium]|jgi:membrane fusion protein (multidrug efflux system)
MPFSRTLRSLAADSSTSSVIGLSLASIIISIWIAWLFLARIPVYAATEDARLEAGPELSLIESPINGRIVAVNIELGKEVKAGDVLFELDASGTELAQKEEQTRATAVAPQIEVLRREIEREEEAIASDKQAARVALEEARLRYQETDEAARFAEDEVKRMSGLYQGGYLSEVEYLRYQSEAKKRRAASDALRLALDRLVWDQRSKENSREAHIESLKREVATLQGTAVTSLATGKRLAYEVSKHLVRASVSGRVGEVFNLRVGSLVREGEHLGAVIPQGDLKAIAYFPPDVALGRVKVGQTAQLRLQGFPWTQYGSVQMLVSKISDEARDGRIRVELRLQPNSNSRIPLQHGLPGAVEIEVERLSPAALVLRTIGRGTEKGKG